MTVLGGHLGDKVYVVILILRIEDRKEVYQITL